MTDDQAGRLGQLAIAAGMHAGALLMAAGLGVAGRELRDPTRRLLLQAALRVAPPKARWEDIQRIAALALVHALEIVGDLPAEA